MSRESVTLFVVFFLIIFGFGSAIIATGIYEAPEEQLTFLGSVKNIISSFKEFYVDIPVFGAVIFTSITALIAYVLYREARGGL